MDFTRCTRCKQELPKTGIPFIVKLVGSEGHWRWIFRHLVRFFVSFGMLRKKDIEKGIPLCDRCGEENIRVESMFLGLPEDEVKNRMGYIDKRR